MQRYNALSCSGAAGKDKVQFCICIACAQVQQPSLMIHQATELIRIAVNVEACFWLQRVSAHFATYLEIELRNQETKRTDTPCLRTNR